MNTINTSFKPENKLNFKMNGRGGKMHRTRLPYTSQLFCMLLVCFLLVQYFNVSMFMGLLTLSYGQFEQNMFYTRLWLYAEASVKLKQGKCASCLWLWDTHLSVPWWYSQIHTAYPISHCIANFNLCSQPLIS